MVLQAGRQGNDLAVAVTHSLFAHDTDTQAAAVNGVSPTVVIRFIPTLKKAMSLKLMFGYSPRLILGEKA